MTSRSSGQRKMEKQKGNVCPELNAQGLLKKTNKKRKKRGAL